MSQPIATLIIRDQVNCKFDGLDAETRRKVVAACKYFNPSAKYSPAFKLGRWDGSIAFATAGGSTYVNMLDVALPIVIEAGYRIELKDERPQHNFTFPKVDENFLSNKLWPKGHPAEGQPIMLRDYQVEAINAYLQNLQSVQVISTGGGKTITTAALSTLVEPFGRSLLIVPSKSLVLQTEKDYKNVGLDVGVYFGDRKEWNHTHTICTWQSLGAFAKAGREGVTDEGLRLSDFLKGVVAVVVDEVHSAKANVLKDLLTGPMAHIPIRWGLTGTLPKQDFDKKTLEVSIGPSVSETTAKSLQDKGVLSNCKVNVLQLDDSHVDYKTYESEYKFLTTDQRRIDFLAETFKTIAETGNTLILVDRIETGKMLKDLLGEDAVFISGNTKMKDRSEEFDSVQQADNKIVIATYGVAAVGINIPRLFNIVLFEAGKSFVRVIQSIGRGLRVAKDKDFVNIFDVTSTLKFSKRHLTERKKYYKDAQYPYAVTKINYR